MKKFYHLIGIIILIVILTRVDLQKIILQFSRFNLAVFILINLLILPGLFFRAYRWRHLLRLQGISYPVRDAFLSYIGGIYAGIVTPGRVGETIKALYLKHDKNVPFGEAMASIFIDRFFDFYLLVLLGGIGFFHFLNVNNIKYRIFIFAVIIFLLAIPLLLLNKVILERSAKLIYKSMISQADKNMFENQFKAFFSAVKKIITQHIYLPFFFTIAAYLFYFLQCYLLARLISIDISFMTIVSFVSISSLISILPITILGIGTREVSLVYLFSLLNFKAESALAYSFLLFFSFYVISGILAFLGWFVKGENINRNG